MAPTTSFAELVSEADAETGRLDRELQEIDLLLQQARIEVGRHEQKRAQATERAQAAERRHPPEPAELRETMNQLVSATRRAALMESQLDVLEGKQKALARYRDRLRELTGALGELAGSIPSTNGSAEEAETDAEAASSRAILDAQEVLRRDIARAMHDGPAQSLTNIVLQAQIVERLMDADPARARTEVGQLIAMVQQTLDATKTFIFDVRPMVLDDLGLVPTLRRAAWERGRRAQVPIEFDSVGPDRRLGEELESALFRVVEDAVTGYLTTAPARLRVRLDWSDSDVALLVRSEHTSELPRPPGAASMQAEQAPHADLPPALVAMMTERREGAAAAMTAAAQARALPATRWTAIQQRARGTGMTVALSADGLELSVRAPFPG